MKNDGNKRKRRNLNGDNDTVRKNVVERNPYENRGGITRDGNESKGALGAAQGINKRFI